VLSYLSDVTHRLNADTVCYSVCLTICSTICKNCGRISWNLGKIKWCCYQENGSDQARWALSDLTDQDYTAPDDNTKKHRGGLYKYQIILTAAGELTASTITTAGDLGLQTNSTHANHNSYPSHYSTDNCLWQAVITCHHQTTVKITSAANSTETSATATKCKIGNTAIRFFWSDF